MGLALVTAAVGLWSSSVGCDMSARGRVIGLLVTALVGAVSPGNVWALLQSCGISAGPVNFGVYNPLSGLPTTATGTVTMTCTVTGIGLFENWTIALGTGDSGTYSARLLENGASNLSYNLYTTAAYTNVWGDGSGTTTLVSGQQTLQVGTSTVNYTVYGRIPAGQDSAAGTYTDAIVVTLNY